MRESLNSNTLFNTIAMVRQDANAIVLVVEGDDDQFVLKRHSSDQMYVLLGVGGRPGVLAAAEIAERRRLNGVRFLVDADYSSLFESKAVFPKNVILSHHHDLFMDMVHLGSAIVDRVVDTHARSLTRRNQAAPDAAVVRAQATALAAKVALARIANERKGLGLNLQRFPFGKLPLEPTSADIARLIWGRSKTSLSIEDLVSEIEAESANIKVEDRYVVGDHDFFSALARVLEKCGVSGPSSEQLTSSFISALTCEILMSADWYSAISSWSESYGSIAFSCPCSQSASA